MGKACFQPTYEEVVAIVGRRIAERRARDEHETGAGSGRRALEAIQDATLIAELFGVTTSQALDDGEREAREREEA